MKITHPDGSTYELENERDVRLYREMHAENSTSAKPAAAATAVARPVKPAPAVTVHKTVKPVGVIRDYDSVLRVIKDYEPDPVGRKEIAVHLETGGQRVSEILADLKRMGMVTNGHPPNSWKWRLTDRAKNAGWEIKR